MLDNIGDSEMQKSHWPKTLDTDIGPGNPGKHRGNAAWFHNTLSKNMFHLSFLSVFVSSFSFPFLLSPFSTSIFASATLPPFQSQHFLAFLFCFLHVFFCVFSCRCFLFVFFESPFFVQVKGCNKTVFLTAPCFQKCQKLVFLCCLFAFFGVSLWKHYTNCGFRELWRKERGAKMPRKQGKICVTYLER